MIKILILDDVTLLKEIDCTSETAINDVSAYLKMTKINVGGLIMDITNKKMINDIKKQPKYLLIYVK
jgi:hypothetical protein